MRKARVLVFAMVAFVISLFIGSVLMKLVGAFGGLP